MNVMFSLDLLDSDAQSNAGAVMHVVNPKTGEPAYLDADKKKPVKAVTISFLGPNSDEAKKYEIKKLRESQAKESGFRKSKNKAIIITDDAHEVNAKKTASLLAALATGWENMPADDKGALIPFSKEKAFELFVKLADLRYQSDEFLGEKTNFI